MSELKSPTEVLQSEVERLRDNNAELRLALQLIVNGYNAPPYNVFDWIAWKQRAEKALGVTPTSQERK